PDLSVQFYAAFGYWKLACSSRAGAASTLAALVAQTRPTRACSPSRWPYWPRPRSSWLARAGCVAMANRFDEKVVVVTGSSRGLGKSLAKTFAREGADVVVTARTEVAGQSKLPGTIHDTVQEIQAAGGRAVPLACDVTKPEQVDAMVAAVLERFGRIDVLVNNAGV